ncbi:hypothetical protein FA13DRAFT_1731614 [Coprinellus micaceus]|uniref:Uncharacterized protein n=1 Tax=Coprinellus micaceus TaxID=71717 RepID=A0A4Y7TE10_COPMI|nr:hypothetical protein FA13DRAFT_1731614 [Coprinellus micaceus]
MDSKLRSQRNDAMMSMKRTGQAKYDSLALRWINRCFGIRWAPTSLYSFGWAQDGQCLQNTTTAHPDVHATKDHSVIGDGAMVAVPGRGVEERRSTTYVTGCKREGIERKWAPPITMPSGEARRTRVPSNVDWRLARSRGSKTPRSKLSPK